MIFNPRISEILATFNVPEKDGLAYLLSLYYECMPTYIPLTIIQKVNISQIIRVENGNIAWLEPLFIGEKEVSTKWKWVEAEYMPLFAECNSKRKGTKSSCISRMKKFFAENPEVRKEEVLEAVRMYIRNLNNPEYLITSHYFIYKDKGSDKTSPLEEWIESYKRYVSTIPQGDNTHVSNIMQG